MKKSTFGSKAEFFSRKSREPDNLENPGYRLLRLKKSTGLLKVEFRHIYILSAEEEHYSIILATAYSTF